MTLGYCRDAWLNLDRDLIRINDEERIDALLNSDSGIPQARMSNFNENEAVTSEVVEIQTDDSSNISANDSNMNNSDENSSEESSSEESGGETSNERGSRGKTNVDVESIPVATPISTSSTSAPVTIVQTSHPFASYESLTVPVAVAVNHSSSSTIYVGGYLNNFLHR